jgi:threonine 3-dehydrogenase
MKALSKLKKAMGLWLTDVPKPTLTRDGVLIKIRKAAICGTDLHIYKWDEWAQKTIKVPMHIGHEFMGEVVAVGEDVKGFAIGDRVSGEAHLTCGHCRNCRAGKKHLCRYIVNTGVNCPGAFAEYLLMPYQNTYKLPTEISDETAAILDPFGNSTHCGEDVLITGAGPVGLMAVAVARKVGARHIVITDVNEYRLKLAMKMGATLAVNPQKISLPAVMQQLGMTEGFDVGLEMSGNAEAFRHMLAAMNNGGNIAFLGIPAQDFAIDWHQVVFKCLTIRGIYGRRMFETWYKMVGLLQNGLDISPVITHRFHIDEFQKAFDVMLSGEAGKVILDWT